MWKEFAIHFKILSVHCDLHSFLMNYVPYVLGKTYFKYIHLYMSTTYIHAYFIRGIKMFYTFLLGSKMVRCVSKWSWKKGCTILLAICGFLCKKRRFGSSVLLRRLSVSYIRHRCIIQERCTSTNNTFWLNFWLLEFLSR